MANNQFDEMFDRVSRRTFRQNKSALIQWGAGSFMRNFPMLFVAAVMSMIGYCVHLGAFAAMLIVNNTIDVGKAIMLLAATVVFPLGIVHGWFVLISKIFGG